MRMGEVALTLTPRLRWKQKPGITHEEVQILAWEYDKPPKHHHNVHFQVISLALVQRLGCKGVGRGPERPVSSPLQWSRHVSVSNRLGGLYSYILNKSNLPNSNANANLPALTLSKKKFKWNWQKMCNSSQTQGPLTVPCWLPPPTSGFLTHLATLKHFNHNYHGEIHWAPKCCCSSWVICSINQYCKYFHVCNSHNYNI